VPGDQPAEGEKLPDQAPDDSGDGKPGDQHGKDQVEKVHAPIMALP
jgi:hypothetical protein